MKKKNQKIMNRLLVMWVLSLCIKEMEIIVLRIKAKEVFEERIRKIKVGELKNE